ncbi:MAG: RHS repeat domain-containing protein [Armatimonadota bacterium]
MISRRKRFFGETAWPKAYATLMAEFCDLTAGIPAVLHEHCDGAGDDGVYCIREPGGSLIARLHPTDGTRYYHFDALGSTRLLTDQNGTVTDRYAYDAYCSLLSHDRYSGSLSQPYQYVGQLGYYTQYQEPDFGLLQLGVRFYDPEVGRFTQMDPVRQGVNWYGYAGGMPTAAIDPNGAFYSWEKCLRLAGEIGKRTADLLSHWAKPKVQQCGGFDPGHLKEVGQKWEKLQELISEFNKHCSGRKPPLPPLPEPVPRPVPAPAPAPAPKPSPGQTCVKVGVGVVILICVWEGAKWTCGALAAPATGGASLCVCGALP